jgi:hypothetical protein
MRRIVSAGAGAGLVLAAIMAVNVGVASVASASPTTTVVTSSDLYGFSCANVAPSGTGQFNVIDEISGCNHPSVQSSGGVGVVSTPAPSAQQGSLQLAVAGTNDHWAAFNYDNDGTSLSAITALSYSTYTSDGGPDTDPSLQLVIDPGSASSAGLDAGCPASATFSTLNFEPYLQGAGVIDNSWQSWDVTGSDGVVWGSHLTACTPEAYSPSGISWSTFLSYYPSATLIGGVGVDVGSGWSAMTGNVGSLTFATSASTTTYIFDPTSPSSSTTTMPNSPTGAIGGTDSDVAIVTGNDVVGSPTGTVSFYECGPTGSPTPCTSMANPVGNPVTVNPAGPDTATASSVSFTPDALGYWCFAGYYSGDSNYDASADASTDECFDVTLNSTSLQTTPTNSTITLGQADTDLGTVTGNDVDGSPTGTQSFYECGPTAMAAPCTSLANPVGIPVNLTPGPGNTSTATSAPFTPTAVGYWCFAGYYSGDSNYTANSDATVDECVDVTPSLTASLQITTRSLPPGVPKTRYSATLAAVGGNPPYRWSRASGHLPGGLHLNRFSGLISGKPSASDSGTYTFTMKVVDRKIKLLRHHVTQNSATQVLSITIL